MPLPGSTSPITDVVTLDEVKAHLRLTNVSATQQAQLDVFIGAATAVVEFYRGEILWRDYTEVYDGGDTAIYLRHTPVLAVTAITENVGTITYTLTDQPVGQTANSYGYTLDDPEVGRVVRRGASGFAWPFRDGVGNVAATYTAGGLTVLPEVKLAALIIVEHLWETQRGAGPRPPSADDGEMSVPGVYYAVPNAAVQLLQTDGQDPVMA